MSSDIFRLGFLNRVAGAIALLAAVSCADFAAAKDAATEAANPSATVSASGIRTAKAARIAGDSKQTRFILDLDGKVPLRAFTLTDPNRVVVDLPQVDFRIGDAVAPRGLIKAFRYGLVMPGASRLVFDLASPAKITNSVAFDAENGQPARLLIELEGVTEAQFKASTASADKADLRPTVVAPPAVEPAGSPDKRAAVQVDSRPVVVIDPGHGGVDAGTKSNDIHEKVLVLDFSLALREKLEATGKYRVVLTREDDSFVTLGDRVRIAREHDAALFLSIHADALPKGEGQARGATIYTLSDKASDAEAQRLADAENLADAIGGVNLGDEAPDVADILIDLAQRETKVFSNRFANQLMRDMKNRVRLHKQPLKSAGFKVLKAPDVPSVLLELGYVSNKADLELLQSEVWRAKAVAVVAQSIDTFLGKRVISAVTVGQ